MSTKANRSRIREQIRRARSAEHLNTRWQRARTPQHRAKAAMDYLGSYVTHAAPGDQRHMASRLEGLARETRTSRPASHAWMAKRLSRVRSSKRRAELAMDCLKAYAHHGSPQGVDRIASRLKAIADSTRTAR